MCVKDPQAVVNVEERASTAVPKEIECQSIKNEPEDVNKTVVDGAESKDDDDHLSSCNETISDCDNAEQLQLSELEELLDAGLKNC